MLHQGAENATDSTALRIGRNTVRRTAGSKAIFERYLDAGGNFLDTADTYQLGESEELLGQFIGERRNDLVLATKFTLGSTGNAGLLATGNSRLVMMRSVEASLRRLRTDRIDLLWVHLPDSVTPAEELVRGLDDLARAGKSSTQACPISRRGESVAL